MDDIETSLHKAWRDIKPLLLADPDELARRLARRRRPTLMRPPRAWCLAVRANDTRIHPASAAIVPEDAAYPGHRLDYDRHEVYLDTRLVRKLCWPIEIHPPGEQWEDIAARLGTSYSGLTTARIKGILRAHHIRGLGGRRGHPVPLLYTDKPLDPAAPLFAEPDPVWSWTASFLPNRLPENFEQPLERVPIYRPHSDILRRINATHPEAAEARQPSKYSRRLPPPEPDFVWYKWKGDQYVGSDWRNPLIQASHERRQQRQARKRETARALRRERGTVSKGGGSLHFNGWNWICPACNRQTRIVFYPLPPLNLCDDAPRLADPGAPGPRQLSGFACHRCHNIRRFSRVDRDAWNQLIAYLSGGLLYGSEVPRPAWFTPDRKRAYFPRPSRAPSMRRQQVLDRLLRGWTYAAIAADLGVGFATVHEHVKSLYQQHAVHSRRQLAQELGRQLPQRESFKRQAVRHALAAGLSWKQIAAKTGLTWTAVHNHVKAIRREQRQRDATMAPVHARWP